MSVVHWADLNRAELSEILPRAVVILPIGAVEQHGEHLPTGTDTRIVTALIEEGAARAAGECGLDVVIAPPVAVGASEHHQAFGGTLSVRAETLVDLLCDLMASMVRAGAAKVLLVNGHGGNSGVCHAAASSASSRGGIDVGHVDYWRLMSSSAPDTPGHAGAFETSMMLLLEPDRVRPVAPRPDVAPWIQAPGLVVHSAGGWSAMDGFTDQPWRATATRGAESIEDITRGLAAALITLGGRS